MSILRSSAVWAFPCRNKRLRARSQLRSGLFSSLFASCCGDGINLHIIPNGMYVESYSDDEKFQDRPLHPPPEIVDRQAPSPDAPPRSPAGALQAL